MLTLRRNNPYSVEKLSTNIFCIHENDEWEHSPLIYLILGDEKALVIDTGCGTGDLHQYIRSSGIMNILYLILYYFSTGSNWSFSALGKLGLSHNVESLCASSRNKQYTELHSAEFDWQVKPYKITRWLNDCEMIYLGKENEAKNVVKIIHTPGHTPDSLTIWFVVPDNRLFIGDLYYQFNDLQLKYSAAKIDSDGAFLPDFEEYHRFFLLVIAGVQRTLPLKNNEYHCRRYESRDKKIKLIISEQLAIQLDKARGSALNQ
ncbi:unnamed protein product [Dracunculus medinensis]|uniref:Lactamase_B domain-containing protein n=1 Tax=Dracunculus medinensis TaxID=318479 RepID=A0A0N4U6H4_DRAME|nr:unnamed protein product [Dracunculus medinensis]